MKLKFFTIILLSAFLPISFFPLNEQIIKLSTRGDKIQSYLLSTETNLIPKYDVVLFPGGNGKIGLKEEKNQIKITSGNNFLVRSREYFVDSQFATAVIDAPSDQKSGMNDLFRIGKNHAEDVSKIIADLKTRFNNPKIYLVGTSKGTISAAFIGDNLGTMINGIIMTSSIFVSGRKSKQIEIKTFPYEKLKVPVLFVHHAKDECPFTPYSEAVIIAEKNHFPLITVHGGLPPESGPCDPYSNHGFFGKEKATVDAIKEWITGSPFKSDIE
jgi:hypothetical protein